MYFNFITLHLTSCTITANPWHDTAVLIKHEISSFVISSKSTASLHVEVDYTFHDTDNVLLRYIFCKPTGLIQLSYLANMVFGPTFTNACHTEFRVFWLAQLRTNHVLVYVMIFFIIVFISKIIILVVLVPTLLRYQVFINKTIRSDVVLNLHCEIEG